MRLPFPSRAEVEATDPNRDTLKLLRWKNLLPLPSNQEEEEIAAAVVLRLERASASHVETIANATGYAA
jgi:hypothetical protein